MEVNETTSYYMSEFRFSHNPIGRYMEISTDNGVGGAKDRRGKPKVYAISYSEVSPSAEIGPNRTQNLLFKAPRNKV